MSQHGPSNPETTEQISSSVYDAPSGLRSEVKGMRQSLDPFTLSPRLFGGRKARQGFAFQDWWIAYTILGLLLEQTSFSYARVEGLEDLDVLLTYPTRSVERYYQVKSKHEGTGKWTVSRLEQEYIFSRFADLYAKFQSIPHDESRDIEFVKAACVDLLLKFENYILCMGEVPFVVYNTQIPVLQRVASISSANFSTHGLSRPV